VLASVAAYETEIRGERVKAGQTATEQADFIVEAACAIVS